MLDKASKIVSIIVGIFVILAAFFGIVNPLMESNEIRKSELKYRYAESLKEWQQSVQRLLCYYSLVDNKDLLTKDETKAFENYKKIA
jgi:hypothetical protein